MELRRNIKGRRPDAQKAADPVQVRGAALRLLARRDFASGDLRDRLERRGFDPLTVTATVTELLEERALDDGRYVENYVATHADRGEGPIRISMELRAQSLPSELIEAALSAVTDWPQRARAVRNRRFGAELPAGWSEKARQARFLQYRGFSSDHIRSALGADVDLD
jgi:regulatory protein